MVFPNTLFLPVPLPHPPPSRPLINTVETEFCCAPLSALVHDFQVSWGLKQWLSFVLSFRRMEKNLDPPFYPRSVFPRDPWRVIPPRLSSFLFIMGFEGSRCRFDPFVRHSPPPPSHSFCVLHIFHRPPKARLWFYPKPRSMICFSPLSWRFLPG